MFTVGIFSTHFPYIAFVLFYAYFLIAGVNKAVAGEISSGEEFCKTEIYANTIFVKSDVDTYHYFCDVSDVSKNSRNEILHFKKKLRYREYSINIPTNYYSVSFFNRPPPVA